MVYCDVLVVEDGILLPRVVFPSLQLGLNLLVQGAAGVLPVCACVCVCVCVHACVRASMPTSVCIQSS